MDRKFTENHHVIHAFPMAIIAANEDMFNGSPRSDVISLHGAQRLIFMIITNHVVAGGSALIRVDGCSDTTPSTTCALTFNVRTIAAPDTAVNQGDTQAYTTAETSDIIYEIEIDACQLAGCSNVPYEFARLTMDAISDVGTDGAVVAFLDGLRNAEDILPTQVA